MQEPLQLPVAGRVMRGVYGFVVLAEKLGLFLLGEVTKNHFRVVRILNLSRLGGHATQSYTRTRTLAGSRRPAGVAHDHAHRPPEGGVHDPGQ